jgi:hypothetical protein
MQNQWWWLAAAVAVAVAAAVAAWGVAMWSPRNVQLLRRTTTLPAVHVRDGDHVMTLQTIRDRKPLIQLVHHFVSDEEIAELLALGESRFEDSTTLDRESGKNEKHPDRTSNTCFLGRSETDTVRRIQDRAATLARLPSANIEPLQLTRYRTNQEYKPHFDYFEPGTQAFRSDTDHGYLDSQGNPVPNQRVITLFVYLTEPAPAQRSCAGGTVFPECNYEVMPTKGAAALFHNFDDVGEVDPTALHGGVVNRCRAEDYVKVGMNIWIRKLPWPGNDNSVEPKTYIQESPPCESCKSVHSAIRCQT